MENSIRKIYNEIKSQTKVGEFTQLLELVEKEIDKNSEWQEAHFEIVSVIATELNKDEITSKVIEDRYSAQGRGGMYELAEELTDKFQKLHENSEWDGDFFDAIEEFLQEELFN